MSEPFACVLEDLGHVRRSGVGLLQNDLDADAAEEEVELRVGNA